MPSEERDAEMLGRKVWECYGGFYTFTRRPIDDIPGNAVPGRWHAEPVAVAIAKVVERVRALVDSEGTNFEQFVPLLADLDAALGGGRNG